MTAGPVTQVVLASASVTRQDLLRRAGVAFVTAPARVDETAIKEAMSADGADAEDCALELARLKAARITPRYPGALVIGADQILDLDGRWFDKPRDLLEARKSLLALCGKTHRLATAACIFRDGAQIWHHLESPELTMRAFTEAFLDHYLAEAGESVLSSVGAYRLEDLGVQLFSRIDGSYFTILGLPLLALLDFLRANAVVTE
ncbi:MAG: Maf family protein [Alphaproteobacteria bacterium]|nr:Maf family protein [Alphaproteobacteria bacterium]